MATSYLMSRKWALTDRFAITDDAGTPHFEVQGRFALTKKLSISDAAGAEVAVITRQPFARTYQILVGGQSVTVSPRGFFGRRFEIASATGQMEASGNFSGWQYSVTRAGVQVAAVSQLRTFREKFAIEVADGEDAVLLLSVVLVIETIRDDRRRQAGAAGAAAGTVGG
jgi:uncharacterized protein YxjI